MSRKDLPATLEVSGSLRKLVDFVAGGARTVYLTDKGRSVAVLLDIDYFNALLDAADTLDNPLEENGVGIMADILKQMRPRSRAQQA